MFFAPKKMAPGNLYFGPLVAAVGHCMGGGGQLSAVLVAKRS